MSYGLRAWDRNICNTLRLFAVLLPFCLLGAAPGRCLEVLPSCAGQNVAHWDNCVGMTSTDGESYQGAFQKGRRHGIGQLVARDGSAYTGEFVENRKQGMGVLKFPNGEAYAGEFKDDMIQGFGAYTWPNGERYSGDFAAGLKSGLGLLSSPFAEPKIGEFGNGDYLGPLQRPPENQPSAAPAPDEMMNGARHSLRLREIIAVSMVLTLALFLLDCALFPPFAAQTVQLIRQQSRRSWLLLVATMLFCGAALFAGGEILFARDEAAQGLKQALAPADESGASPM